MSAGPPPTSSSGSCGRALSVALAVLGVLAACVAQPAGAREPAHGGSSSRTPAPAFLPCVVFDASGYDDHSANQLAFTGVLRAARTIGGTYKSVQSRTVADGASNIERLISERCTLIVTSGVGFASAVSAAAVKHPRTEFLVIGDDQTISAPNIEHLFFATDEAAFLGGYAAAAYSRSGVVATFGGYQYPSTTTVMDGLAEGIAYYDQQKGASVRLLGWSESSQRGTFLHSLTDQEASAEATDDVLSRGADVVVPVCGQLYQGAARAIEDSGGGAVLEGVGADLYESDTGGHRGLVLTSILEDVEPQTATAITAAARGSRAGATSLVEDLADGGVSLAPFHDYATRIPTSLPGELLTIEARIEDGSIVLRSPVVPPVEPRLGDQALIVH